MKMDEHARAWGHEFVAGLLNSTALPTEQRNSLHWEILSHLHEKAERRVAARGGNMITLIDLQATIQELGGRDGIAGAFLQTRVVATPRAGIGKRVAAFLIDALIAIMVLGFFTAVVLEPFDSTYLAGMWYWSEFYPLLMMGAFFGYNAVAEVRWGTTIGKMVFKLRTVMVDGRPLTSQAAVIRNLVKSFPPALFIDFLIYILAFSKEDQRGSDRIANTIVIDTTKTAWMPPPAAPVAAAPGPGPAKTFIPVDETRGPSPEYRPPQS